MNFTKSASRKKFQFALLALTGRVLGNALVFADPTPKPLIHTHAHNDYEHPRPLFDALDHGFCSVEADVYLVNDALLVAHEAKQVRPERTLQSLYLDPLLERVRKNGGHVYPDGPEFFLLIDVKSDGEKVYEVLRPMLEKYAEMLTEFTATDVKTKAVTVVISGNCPRQSLMTELHRYAGIDGRIADLPGNVNARQMPWISDRWSEHFHWYGSGPMPDDQRQKLREIVEKVHAQGKKLRFWATLDKPEVWKELLDANVDFINADHLAELEQFLREREK